MQTRPINGEYVTAVMLAGRKRGREADDKAKMQRCVGGRLMVAEVTMFSQCRASPAQKSSCRTLTRCPDQLARLGLAVLAIPLNGQRASASNDMISRR